MKNKSDRSLNWLHMIIVIAILFCCWRTVGRLNKYNQLKAECEVCRQQLEQAEYEYGQKLETVALLNDDAYIERLARVNLGMVREGEIPVSTVKVDEPTVDTVGETDDAVFDDGAAAGDTAQPTE